MALPFAPAENIQEAFVLNIKTINVNPSVSVKLQKFKHYIKSYWIDRITPADLSVFGHEIATNNGAESFHGKLKQRIEEHRPNIWVFMGLCNHVLSDYSTRLGHISAKKTPDSKCDVSWTNCKL